MEKGIPPGGLPDLTETCVVSDLLHDGGFVRFERDTVTGPGPEEMTRYVMRHCGAVAVIPLFSNGDILLVHQYRYPIKSHTLETPAGRLDIAKEEPLACAQRELAEETSYRSDRWEHLFNSHSSVGFTDELLRIFVAYDIEPDPNAPENPPDESTHPVRLSLEQLQERFTAGEITEGRTQLAMMWLAAQRR